MLTGRVAPTRLAAYGAFFREENTIILETRSILCYPPGRLLILSDKLALVLPLCKGRSNIFTLLSVSDLCVWLQGSAFL